jgi:hypothetical protein
MTTTKTTIQNSTCESRRGAQSPQGTCTCGKIKKNQTAHYIFNKMSQHIRNKESIICSNQNIPPRPNKVQQQQQ